MKYEYKTVRGVENTQYIESCNTEETVEFGELMNRINELGALGWRMIQATRDGNGMLLDALMERATEGDKQ